MAPDAKGPIDPLDALGNLYDRPAAAPRPAPATRPRVEPTPPVPGGKRPTSMTVIGWVFIVGSILTALSALSAMAASRMMGEALSSPEALDLPPDVPPVFHLFLAILPFFGLLALVQLASAAFVLYAAIQFLRRRAWARTALESMTWLSIVGTVGFVAAWAYMWTAMASGIPAQPGAPSPTSFTLAGIGIAVVLGAIYVVPMAVIVGFLRGKTIRGAVVR